MKARVKATGEVFTIADYARVVVDACNSHGNPLDFSYEEVEFVDDVKEKSFPKDDDYWTRFEHQAAIAAMPIADRIVDGLCGSGVHPYNGSRTHTIDSFVDECYGIARALVEKLKEESK